MCRLYFLFLGLLIPLQHIHAQNTDNQSIAASVQLDSIVVIAQKAGFDVPDFIRMVQQDKSFSTAFQNLRNMQWRGHHTMSFYSSKGKQTASYYSKTRQYIQDGCSMHTVDTLHTQGDFYKKRKEYRYITAKLYDKVFFTPGKVCPTPYSQVSGKGKSNADERGLDKYYQELKTFIFEPGTAVDLPFIGSKTAIFSPKLTQYYDYAIRADTSSTGKPSYIFQLKIKPEYATEQVQKTMVKFMETTFERSTLQVLERRYRLTYATAAFRFDVELFVWLAPYNGSYYPREVRYSGSWDIPFHPSENGTFSAQFYPF